MIVDPKHSGGGDPTQFCDELLLRATGDPFDAWDEAKRIAVLARVLADPEQRERLFDMAARIEAESAPPADLVGC